MQFSTINESSLHKTLKIMFAERFNGETEIEQDGHIFDILTNEKQVIEIQTKNLTNLLAKLSDTLNKGYKVNLVHPIETVKIIETYDNLGKLLSKRKSPKKGRLYSLLKELTGIYPILLNENLTLTVLETSITEERVKTNEPIQSKNNRRRFRKDWIKKNKRLNEIISEKEYKNADDYLNLLPVQLPKEFCAKDIKTAYMAANHKEDSATANLLLWILNHMELIEFTEVKNRSKYYKIK